LADLVAAFLLENAVDQFKDTRFKGIYRDDGFIVFEGELKKKDVANWLDNFQARVDELAGSNFLNFTAEVWGADKDDGMLHKAVSVNKGESFPYLDMEMYWSVDNQLFFKVHLKPNQQLKYLNRGSTHTEACFKSIPSGVLKRLASLTTRTEDSEMKCLDKLYPLHASVLRSAKLIEGNFPTLGEVLDEMESKSNCLNGKGKEEETEPR
jgi:hypothetical protein